MMKKLLFDSGPVVHLTEMAAVMSATKVAASQNQSMACGGYVAAM